MTNLLHYTLRRIYNKSFNAALHREIWKDLEVTLLLSGIPKLEVMGETEWSDGHDSILEILLKKYDSEGTCTLDDYAFVSQSLRDEYDMLHSLIRSLIEDQLYNYIHKIDDSYEDDLD